MVSVLPDILAGATSADARATALRYKSNSISYGDLHEQVRTVAAGFAELGLARGERVAVFAGKQPEMVAALLGSSLAGGVFVPINTLLKPAQVSYILNDCNVRTLVTTASRLAELAPVLDSCPDLRSAVVLDAEEAPAADGLDTVTWRDLLAAGGFRERRLVSTDMAAIMYTSGSTGKPKGVVLSHANLVIGAESVASYIENDANDRILAALPFSFDAGLSQLTTGLVAGATIVLHDYFLPRDVVRVIEKEGVTGLTGVPPLWMQLAELEWPPSATESLRYFANTGGKMPGDTLGRLRQIFPQAKPFLMYGLTEAFRSTYLPPSEVDRRPDSIGKAVPNVEVMVVSPEGRLCEPGEVGELVHRGPLVSLGYWNDPERTAVRFRPSPNQPAGIPTTEIAVFSGDSVRMDDEGFLYFVGRIDDMIKTSGYRVSPAEVEEVVYDSGLVSEVAALGIPHDRLGQGIVLVAKARDGEGDIEAQLLAAIRPNLPNYMMPMAIVWKETLPRNANGKIDRKVLIEELASMFSDSQGDAG